MIYGTLTNRTLSENWSGSTRFRNLNKRPPKGYSWKDGELAETLVASDSGTIWPEVWSSVSTCAQKEATQLWEMNQPKFQAARQINKIHDIPPFLRHCSNRQKEGRDFNGTSNAMRYTSTHPDRQGTDSESCSQVKVESDPWHRTTHRTNRERPIEALTHELLVGYADFAEDLTDSKLTSGGMIHLYQFHGHTRNRQQ